MARLFFRTIPSALLFFGIVSAGLVCFIIPASSAELSQLGASTYIGGSKAQEFVAGMTMDKSGNIFIVGNTISTDFPTTTVAYDVTAPAGNSDVFVSKFSPDLSILLASTFLGSSEFDQVHDIAIDSFENVFVTGYTYGNNFPTTLGAYDTTFNASTNGRSDVFVAKFSSTLANLKASTLLGGAENDSEPSFALSPTGDVVVAGLTGSIDFPVTVGASVSSFFSFVATLSSDLKTLKAGRYIQDGFPEDVVVDAFSNVFVGGTASQFLSPLVQGYDLTYNDLPGEGSDAFLMKFSPDLQTVMSSTFLGGGHAEDNCEDSPEDNCEGQIDDIRAMLLDSSGNVVVTGYTGSDDFPVTGGAYDETFNGMNDIFVSKFSPNLKTLLSSTYIGGEEAEVGLAIARDAANNTYISGGTGSVDFPVFSGAFDTTLNAVTEGVAFKLSPSLSQLMASTYLGGQNVSGLPNTEGANDGFGIAAGFDKVYVAGIAGYGFPTTAGAYDEVYNGNGDGYVLSFLGGPSGFTPMSMPLMFDAAIPEIESGKMISFNAPIQLPKEVATDFLDGNGNVTPMSPQIVSSIQGKTFLGFGTVSLAPDTYVLRVFSSSGFLLAQSSPFVVSAPKIVYKVVTDKDVYITNKEITVKVYPGLYAFDALMSGAYELRWVDAKGQVASPNLVSSPSEGFSLYLLYTYDVSALNGTHAIQLRDTTTGEILAEKQVVLFPSSLFSLKPVTKSVPITRIFPLLPAYPVR
ncbi:MAG TPA: hypothetical protein DCY48_01060 [Candidatus Magasanikbacteria bacterium]|nr:MAG: hypothetical protein A3I74_01850 [Candidatus Magasanikbacteria bacterium RIFCSPLOWO2_02_FULL_47_16]OGH79833.1 MAG: hypothetical protein A3C10_05240 [Candidatus Magasanikbacteria bacterium RIFCSPHIGHO2_02_FULL_48_18]OGH83054.1 MAG: hypothetical protein A3G08_01415 [Candidatus Magasanikbacteria bacterium RIFCSPLOWO2_12_FULL_47_9b]HAZ28348.1 hypothetical protein [Candidatus Magasanikbacteria bacterium]